MYVVFTVVQIDSGKLPDARQMLEAQLIPGVKQAPGFAKGIWFGDDQSGHGVVVFESREQAEQVRHQLNSVVAEGMRVVESGVYEVHAEA